MIRLFTRLFTSLALGASAAAGAAAQVDSDLYFGAEIGYDRVDIDELEADGFQGRLFLGKDFTVAGTLFAGLEGGVFYASSSESPASAIGGFDPDDLKVRSRWGGDVGGRVGLNFIGSKLFVTGALVGREFDRRLVVDDVLIEDSDFDTRFEVGAGVEFAILDTIAFRARVTTPASDPFDDMRFLAGASLRF